MLLLLTDQSDKPVKTCTQCEQLKSLDAFHADKRLSSGISGRCRSCESHRGKSYRASNKEDLAKKAAVRRNSPRGKQLKKEEYIRSKGDINCKLARAVRNRIYGALKKNIKSGSAVRDLGCTIPEFKLYIESLFQPGMTWENWGHWGNVWHIDHISPLASYKLTDREQFLRACHYTNMQPLWAIDNAIKGARSLEEFLALKAAA